jgi:phospholipid transport system transporter-binding protein
MLMLPATVTEREARDTLRMLGQAMQREDGGKAVIVDAAALAKFDSSAIAVLLECRRQAQAGGRLFAVRHMPQRLADLAKLYGVQELLPQVDPAAS